jgi:transcription-repair coupling factor (superfamily II helicase)
MLKEAIEERRGVSDEDAHFEVEIDLDVDAYLPDEYISDSKQKIMMYKQFRGVSSMQDMIELQEEIIDRFGDYPQEVGYLFQITGLKLLAAQERVESIKQSKLIVTFLFSEKSSQNIDGGKLFMLGNSLGRNIGLGMEGNKLKVTINTKDIEVSKWLTMCENLLKGLKNVKKEVVNA